MKKRIGIVFILAALGMFTVSCIKIPRKVINLSIWGAENSTELYEEMAEEFSEMYAKEADIRITVCEESEGTCRETVLFSPENAADVFTFADDQLESLVSAGALMSLEEDRALIEEDNGGKDSVAVQAASCKDGIYAYPMTASNGYFLYYDSRYYSEDDVRTFDSLLKVAEGKGKKVSMDLTSGWYLYSFFKGAGMDVSVNDDGDTNTCDFNRTSGDIRGVDVAEAIGDIAADPAFLCGNNDEVVAGVESGDIIAAVSGTWNEAVFQKAFGEGYSASKLPEFSVAGRNVQMHSVAGYKLAGVNAHSENPQWAKLLARFITNEENQMKRFERIGEGPSNVRAAASTKVKSSKAITALSQQMEFAHLQRVAGSYWDPMYRFGIALLSGKVSDDELQELLDNTVEEIEN